MGFPMVLNVLEILEVLQILPQRINLDVRDFVAGAWMAWFSLSLFALNGSLAHALNCSKLARPEFGNMLILERVADF